VSTTWPARDPRAGRPVPLESALLNFALNARDAMPDGGRLHIAARPIELDGNAAPFALPAAITR
jgi:hypothetical protein